MVGTALLLLLLSGPTLASAALTNAGILTLRDGLMAQADLALGVYPHYNVLPDGPTAARAMNRLRWALVLDGDNLPARWTVGRVALALGDAETAADALHPLIAQAARRPLVYDDVLISLSQGGAPESVIALYEIISPSERTQVISDTVALAYLEQRSKGAGEQGGKREEYLNRVKELRPGDLYINYYLWKRAQEIGDVRDAAVYSQTLTYFPLEAVDPTDERLLDYAVRVIPTLLEEGVWDRERMLNVVSYLVWQHNRAAGVERLLEDLVARYPAEPDWPFYLAELYHRRGDLDHADMTYQRVIEIDTEYAQAYLRLGMIHATRAERKK